MLTYAEAHLFERAGFDVRWADWPADWFVRESVGPQDIEGYDVEAFVPSDTEINGDKWRVA